MAHVLSLSYGSTTIALASGDYRIKNYTPRVGSESSEFIEESATIQVEGSTIAAFQANVQAINRAFEAARKRRQGKTWDRLFLVFQPDGYSVSYRTEITEGRLLVPDTILQADWANKQADVTLIYTRRNFWEAAAWIAVPLSNANNLLGTTDPLRVYNCADGAGGINIRTNLVQIAAASVAGDLPAPVALVMAPAQDTNGIYMGLYVDETGGGVPTLVFDSDAWTTGISDTADATCSGGSYKDIPANASDADVATLAGIDLTDYRGNWWRPFVRNRTPSDNTLAMRFYVGSVLMSDMQLRASGASRTLQAFDMIRIPSWPYLVNPVAGTFALRRKGDAAAPQFGFDVLYLMPTDAYAEIGRDDSAVVSSGQVLVETWDINAQSYIQNADTTNQYRFCNIRVGAGIFLTPGKNQNLYFLMRNDDDSDIGMYMTVQMFYKPRRRSL